MTSPDALNTHARLACALTPILRGWPVEDRSSACSPWCSFLLSRECISPMLRRAMLGAAAPAPADADAPSSAAPAPLAAPPARPASPVALALALALALAMPDAALLKLWVGLASPPPPPPPPRPVLDVVLSSALACSEWCGQGLG